MKYLLNELSWINSFAVLPEVFYSELQKTFDEQPANGHYTSHPPEWADNIEVCCSS